MWHYIVLFLVIFPVSILLKNFLVYMKRKYHLKDMPTPEGGLFLIGHSHILERDPAAFYKQILDYCSQFQNDELFSFWIGPYPVVVCNRPSMVEAVLGSNNILTKSMQYRMLHPWIGFGLLTAPPGKWRSRRKMLTPTFHFSVLQNYYPIMNQHARTLLEVIDDKLFSLSADNKQPAFDIFPFIVSNALDIICEAAMGYNLDSLRNKQSPYANAITQMTDIVTERMKRPHYYFETLFRLTSLGSEYKKALDIIHEFTSTVVKARRKEMQDAGVFNETELMQQLNKKGGWRLAFLDLLLYEQFSNGTLTDNDIQEEVDTFMFEGHDTTAVAIAWCLYLIGTDPNVQKKLHEELDEVFPVRHSDVSNEHIGKLQYLDKIIKESLRLFPSVPFIGREAREELKLLNYTIPVGTTVMVMPMALHRNPACFTDPDEFRPDRFEKVDRHPYSYVPFSAGPRNCIGAKFAQLELKIVLSWVMRNYHVKSLQKYEECKPAGGIILRPSEGVILKFERRD